VATASEKIAVVVATTCEYGGLVVDPTGPAVLLGGKAPFWQPFLEDLRSSAFKLAHAKCFAENSGLDPLLTIITESDRQLRLSLSNGHRRIWELERRIADLDKSSLLD
jgi:hypothetical protein